VDAQDSAYWAVLQAQRVGTCKVLFEPLGIDVPFSKPTQRLVDGLLRIDPTRRLAIVDALEMAEDAPLALEQA
jgi:hypothetical protein